MGAARGRGHRRGAEAGKDRRRSDAAEVEPELAMGRPLVTPAPRCARTGLIDQFKEIDCWRVQYTCIRHRILEIRRISKFLGLPRVLCIEDDHDLTLIAVGRVVDPWIAEASCLLLCSMRIKEGTPLAVVPHLMTDNHHAHIHSPPRSH